VTKIRKRGEARRSTPHRFRGGEYHGGVDTRVENILTTMSHHLHCFLEGKKDRWRISDGAEYTDTCEVLLMGRCDRPT
jgi:hypothetical protein